MGINSSGSPDDRDEVKKNKPTYVPPANNNNNNKNSSGSPDDRNTNTNTSNAPAYRGGMYAPGQQGQSNPEQSITMQSPFMWSAPDSLYGAADKKYKSEWSYDNPYSTPGLATSTQRIIPNSVNPYSSYKAIANMDPFAAQRAYENQWSHDSPIGDPNYHAPARNQNYGATVVPNYAGQASLIQRNPSSFDTAAGMYPPGYGANQSIAQGTPSGMYPQGYAANQTGGQGPITQQAGQGQDMISYNPDTGEPIITKNTGIDPNFYSLRDNTNLDSGYFRGGRGGQVDQNDADWNPGRQAKPGGLTLAEILQNNNSGKGRGGLAGTDNTGKDANNFYHSGESSSGFGVQTGNAYITDPTTGERRAWDANKDYVPVTDANGRQVYDSSGKAMTRLVLPQVAGYYIAGGKYYPIDLKKVAQVTNNGAWRQYLADTGQGGRGWGGGGGGGGGGGDYSTSDKWIQDALNWRI